MATCFITQGIDLQSRSGQCFLVKADEHSISTGYTNKLSSPNSLKSFSLGDTSLIYNDGTEDRLVIDGANSTLFSPDFGNYMRLSNSAARMVVNGYIRLNINASTGYLRSNDGTNRIQVKGASISIQENSKDRVWVDNVFTELYSPSRNNYLRVYNSGLLFVHAGNDRIKVDGNYTNIYSPDGGNLNIGNDGVFYSGATVQMSTHKGVVNGIAELDASGIVPVSQLPAYVDAIDEYADLATLISTDPQEANKVYITTDDNKVFRYTGTSGSYAEISSTLVLGTTNTTAYRGDRGLIAYDHSQSAHSYEPINANIVKSTAGVLPVLDGSNLTGISADSGNQIISPDELKYMMVSNINLLYSDRHYARLYIDDTESRLTSPGGQSLLQVKNGDFNFYDGTRDRIEADGIGTTLRSTTGAYLSMLSNAILFNDNTRTRITADDAGTRLYSTGANASYLSIADAAIYLNDGARARLQIDDNDTILYSPGGTKFLVVDNNGTAITGAMAVTSSGTAITSIDSNNGVGLSVKQPSADKPTIIDFYEDGATRKGWFGYGSSGYRHNMYVFNDYADGNLVLIPRDNNQAGIVDVIGIVKAKNYQSSDGTTGVTGIAASNKTLTIKNGLVVGIS